MRGIALPLSAPTNACGPVNARDPLPEPFFGDATDAARNAGKSLS